MNKKPIFFSQIDTSNPRVSNVVRAAKNTIIHNRDSDNKKSFIMTGPNGTGKTMIARAMLWSSCYMSEGVPIAPVGRFFTESELINNEAVIKGSFDSVLSKNCPMIVIDDVGSVGNIQYTSTDGQTAEKQARLFVVIDFCYTNDIPVIMTASNKTGSIPNFLDYIGPRNRDRLLQMAPAGQMWELSGVDSYRVKAGGR